MAYRNLYTPLSQFVDPMSTEIAEELRQRFLTNYSGASEVQLKMAELRAAPFESDRKMRDELVTNTTGTLTSIASRGDYENMTVPVMNAAKKYQIESAPIKQNYELYTGYQQAQKDLYEKGEIDYEQYLGNIDLSTSEYGGLQKDQTGNYAGYFTGVDAITTTDEKIQERMHKALNDIVAEEFSKDAQIVGVDSASGKLLVLEQGKVKTVSEQRVNEVMDMIMNDRQIQAYMGRKGKIRAMRMTPEGLVTARDKRVKAIDQYVLELQKEKDKTNNEERKALIEREIQNQMETAATLMGANDTATLRSLFAFDEAVGMDRTFRNAATARYARYSETTSQSVLPEWAQVANGLGGYGGGPVTAIPGRIEDIPNPSGNTHAQMTAVSTNQAAVLAQMEDPRYMQEKFNVPLTASEIVQMTPAEFSQMHPDISPEFFKNAQAVIHNAQATKAAVDARLAEARRTLNIDPAQELEQVKANVNGAAEAIRTVSARLNVPEQEALNLIGAYFSNMENPNRTRITPSLGATGVGVYETSGNFNAPLPPDVQATMDAIFRPNYTRDPNADPGDQAVGDMAAGVFSIFGIGRGGQQDPTPRFGDASVASIVRGVSRVRQENIDILDDYLEDRSRSQTSFPTFDNMPFGFRLTKAEKSSFDATFKAGSPAAQFATMSFYDAAGNVTTFDKAAESRKFAFGAQGEGFNSATATLVGTRFSPYDYGSMGASIIATFEDEDGRSIQVPMPMSQINNTGIDRYMSSNINKFANIVGQQYSRQVENIVVPLKNPATGARYLIAVDIADATQSFQGSAYAVDDQGNKIEGSQTYTLEELTDPDPQKGLLMRLQQQGFYIAY